MLEQLYGWIRNIAVYLVVMTGVMHIVPGKEYRKYIRFFSGLILIILLASPLLKLTGMWEDFGSLYRNREYEMEVERIERAAEEYREAGLSDLLPEEYRTVPEYGEDAGTAAEEGGPDQGKSIEVEEIRIGE